MAKTASVIIEILENGDFLVSDTGSHRYPATNAKAAWEDARTSLDLQRAKNIREEFELTGEISC